MNKKLIKTIASVACGLGITSTIPFISTSCGCSHKFVEVDVPSEIYNIDENGILQGFKEDEDLREYSNCNTLKLPANVKGIYDYAF